MVPVVVAKQKPLALEVGEFTAASTSDDCFVAAAETAASNTDAFPKKIIRIFLNILT